MSLRILITSRDFPKHGKPYELLRNKGYTLEFRVAKDPFRSHELAQHLPDMDGVILGVDDCDANALAKANKLKVLSRFGVGYDSVDVTAATQKGIVVTRAVGANAPAVAELSLGYMFALARSLVKVASGAKNNVFVRPRGWELSGKTLGLIGYGAIGQLVAQKAAALGMKVMVFTPSAKPEPSNFFCDLDTLLSRSDVVSLHCALTPDSKNLLNDNRISQMKQGAYLINTARGALVDEIALHNALINGHLAGAATDAFAQEPPTNNPLLELDNFIATDHIGANTHESVANVALLSAQNLIAVLDGKACPNIVNPEIYKEAPYVINLNSQT